MERERKLKTIRKLNTIFLCLFFVCTLVTLAIVFNNIDTPFSIKFVLFYVIFLLLYGLFVAVQLLINLRKLSRADIGKRILRFLIWFVCLFGLQLLYYLLFKPTAFHDWNVGTSFGFAVAGAFGDLLFSRKKQ
jgi:hypothetical protein